MAPNLLLDECVSPNISDALWTEGIDNYPTRNRGLLNAADHSLFARAISDGRVIVTINATHYRKLAQSIATHPGIIVIPSGGNRSEQLHYILKAIDWARAKNAVLPSFKDMIVTIDESGTITAEKVHAPPEEQAVQEAG
jgi:predicted nuclease of predicted toxin-antitoxin system